MSISKECAQAIEYMTDLLDVWEVPVCAADLYKAHPGISRYTYAHALKQMQDASILYAQAGARDRTYYIPVGRRPMCPVQELICKGRIEAEEEWWG